MFAKSHICHISLPRSTRVVALVQNTKTLIGITSIENEAGAGTEVGTETVTAGSGLDPKSVRNTTVMKGKHLFQQVFKFFGLSFLFCCIPFSHRKKRCRSKSRSRSRSSSLNRKDRKSSRRTRSQERREKKAGRNILGYSAP